MATFSTDEFFMHRCLELAQLGANYAAPNPMVGAVVVHNHKIIGEGYHEYCGGPHAEVNAINQVKDKRLLSQSSIFVNLEPCAHFGKTPPCADLIVHHKIPKVFIGMQDPFAKVNGEGIRRIKASGATVVCGILEKECKELNKFFITFHTRQRPYIILKWAQTSDGFIDVLRNEEHARQPNWITNESCRTLVHKWRSETAAILVGTNTALCDNPSLNVRTWSGKSPVRIVLDRTLRLPQHLNLFNQQQPTLVFNEQKSETQPNLEFIKATFDTSLLSNILNELYKRQLTSVIIEGGQHTLQHFIDQDLWDEARVFTGKNQFNEGVKAPVLAGNLTRQILLDGNWLSIYKNNNQQVD